MREKRTLEALHLGPWWRQVTFCMEVTGCFKSCVERQINEAVRKGSSKVDHILNSKTKFHQAPLIRQVMAHGLAGEQGEDLVVLRRGGGRSRGGSLQQGQRKEGRGANVKGKVEWISF